MRIQDLFTIPEGKKATDKVFGRVLISSICSILLCMVCLASTTWAWFTVSLENEGNLINIGFPEVEITVDEKNFDSGDKLDDGDNNVVITHAGDVDDFQRKSTLYVTLTVAGTDPVCVMLDGQNDYEKELTIQIPAGEECQLSCVPTWFKPDNVQMLTGDTITITQADLADPIQEDAEDAENIENTENTIPENTEENLQEPSATEPVVNTENP